METRHDSLLVVEYRNNPKGGLGLLNLADTLPVGI